MTDKLRLAAFTLWIMLVFMIGIFIGSYLQLVHDIERMTCPDMYCPRATYNLTCSSPPVYTSCPSQPELPLFMTEALTIPKAHDYVDMEYMCGNFAMELFTRLASDGYSEVKICEGTSDGFNHYWINIGSDIHIESITGEVISPKDYENHYRESHCYGYIPSHIKVWVESYVQ